METNNGKIRRALISVYNKTGLVPFARLLVDIYKVEILSTGGTAKTLAEAGVPVTDVSDWTDFPECFDGRVKTLHPKVHGGILYMRDNAVHVKTAEELDIQPIDLVVVNLYPFKETVAKPGVKYEEVIENIDIGGPAMLRSAAKNHDAVTVVVDPEDYQLVAHQMSKYDGATTFGFRRQLATKVFAHTTAYDAAIARYLRPVN
jgi:phosphoribosylaminoimidazolecarboxamide formyltransferase/IMP cyclohydrolase